MKSIATLVVCAISGIACVNLSAHAAEGEHTISLGYAHFQFPGLKDFVKGQLVDFQFAFFVLLN